MDLLEHGKLKSVLDEFAVTVHLAAKLHGAGMHGSHLLKEKACWWLSCEVAG